jgi:hypothetical protein
MTVATRGNVQRSVLNPYTRGPARNACSIFANCLGPSLGLRPARPAALRPARPFACQAWYQWWAVTRVTPKVRATTPCDAPLANSPAAWNRRASNAAKSRRERVGLAMPQHAIIPVKSVSLFCETH